MDFNHDYVEHEPFLLAGAKERLQMCKCAILAYGDLGYTDPALPDIRGLIGEYTDTAGATMLEKRIREILEIGQLVTPDEILSISVDSPIGGEGFHVSLDLAFGSEVFDVPAVL